jgi:hypothetical protein
MKISLNDIMQAMQAKTASEYGNDLELEDCEVDEFGYPASEIPEPKDWHIPELI